MQPFVDFKNVSLRYGGVEKGLLALSDINLQVKEGEFVAIVGPSGCGKSTFLKATSGLWPVTSGEIVVNNAKVKGPVNCVGMAFQNPTLLPWRNTLDNVMLPLEVVKPQRYNWRQKRSEYVQAAKTLLDMVSLAGSEDKFPWELSGGMQQRVSICRSLIHDPKLLMLDEPFGALDMFTREDLWTALQDIWLKKRPTIILVTHDIREAVYLADRVIIMAAKPGRIVSEQTITFTRPRPLTLTFDSEFGEIFSSIRAKITEVSR
ncbi:ABC transporter ATP-binding protein [Pelagibacterium lacus]|uniref:ABC transporter ATP-binding protein n=1 Tax=Pelagibacterium lacus TaxID=2282655 RepID=A0A369W605_9HYPH|nr:ABC transporter ATP-binding protein [Pelagibacterium lacus]RDE10086.1 ABC transporter ATP-binding protein [Pelagibacterium lacus]